MWTAVDREIIRPSALEPKGMTKSQDSEVPAVKGVELSMLLRTMDEIDHGMLVIDAHCQVRHVNHLARYALTQARFLVRHGNMLMGSKPAFTQQIDQALKNAVRGHRQMIALKDGDTELTIAFVPLSHPVETHTPLVLVMLSRQSVCENLAVRMYARAHLLSPSEELVLIALCKGESITDIAKEHGVAVSTVRSQIKAVRQKTGSNSIRTILLRVNNLPPVMSALRAVTPVAHNGMAFV